MQSHIDGLAIEKKALAEQKDAISESLAKSEYVSAAQHQQIASSGKRLPIKIVQVLAHALQLGTRRQTP